MFSKWFSRRPKIVQFEQLSAQHFDEHPIWLDIHLHDFGKWRFRNEDEGAYRPWDGTYPAHSNFTGAVAATFQTADGNVFAGFVDHVDRTDRDPDPVIEFTPILFLPNGETISFWHGAVYLFGDSSLEQEKQNLYETLKPRENELFPIALAISSNVLHQSITFEISGFCYYSAENVAKYVR